MDYFQYKNNILHAEDVNILNITKKIKTPFYLYSKKTILRHFHQIADAFKEIDPLICFSVKSNSNPYILKTLRKAGSGFDIVSQGEGKKALQAGADQKKIVFAGVEKTEEEIRWAIRSNIFMFNCESTNEILLINKIAKKLNKKIRIAIRINPDITPDTHKHIITGKKETKFGISIYEINKVIQVLKQCKNIDLKGLHFHIGSQIIKADPFIKAIKKSLNLISSIEKQKFNIEYLNIGGGPGIIYKDEKPQNPFQFAKKVIPLIKEKKLKLIMEPGRYVVGNGGILVTKVIYIKKSLNNTFVIVDAGMNTLIRPALYEAYHQIIPVKHNSKKYKVNVVGPICETGDMFAKDRPIGKVEENDYLVIKSAGAYGRVMASTYNERPLPFEVMADKKSFKKI